MGRSEHLFMRAMLGDPKASTIWLNNLFEGKTVLRDLKELAEELLAYSGAAQVIVTLGERGSYVFCGGKETWIPAVKVEVEDTPGAGDAFTAGVTFGLFHGATLTDAARFGSLTAAHAVTFKESLPGFGTLAEICSFAQANGVELPEVLKGHMPSAESMSFRT